jgi:hypothetical protein
MPSNKKSRAKKKAVKQQGSSKQAVVGRLDASLHRMASQRRSSYIQYKIATGRVKRWCIEKSGKDITKLQDWLTSVQEIRASGTSFPYEIRMELETAIKLRHETSQMYARITGRTSESYQFHEFFLGCLRTWRNDSTLCPTAALSDSPGEGALDIPPVELSSGAFDALSSEDKADHVSAENEAKKVGSEVSDQIFEFEPAVSVADEEKEELNFAVARLLIDTSRIREAAKQLWTEYAELTSQDQYFDHDCADVLGEWAPSAVISPDPCIH